MAYTHSKGDKLNTPTYDQIIDFYGLEPHMEGGFYKTSFSDDEDLSVEALPPEYSSPRPFMNSILYLLPNGEKSVFHRIRMNEIWAFHLGGPLELFQISPDGTSEKICLGTNILKSEKIFHVVPKGFWMGARPADDSEYSLVSCITAPGFKFEDWEAANINQLLKSSLEKDTIDKFL